jgi:O-antigen ligase
LCDDLKTDDVVFVRAPEMKAVRRRGTGRPTTQDILAPPTAKLDADVVELLRLRPGAFVRTFLNESAAFAVCCAYLMFEYVRPQSIYSWLDGMPVTQVTLLLGLGLVAMERLRDKQPIYGSQWLLLGAYFGTAVISMLLGNYPIAENDKWILLLTWLMAIFIITGSVTSEKRLLLFLVCFLLFSFKMSQHGFRSWAGRGFTFAQEGVHGAPGWFHNSGEVGIQMCIFMPMMLYFMKAGWPYWSRATRVLVCVVPVTIVGTIIGSSSRGAVFGVLAAMSWIFLRADKRRALLATSVLAVALIVIAALPDEFGGRFTQIGQDSSSQLRLAHWAFGWHLAKEHPVLGVGLGNWIPAYREYLETTGSNVILQVSHNIFIEAVAELGFVGLGMLILIIGSCFVLNRRTRHYAGLVENDFLRLTSLGLDAGMIGFLVSAQFVTVLYYPYLWIHLAITIALHNVTCRTWHDRQENARPTRSRLRIGRFSAPARNPAPRKSRRNP